MTTRNAHLTALALAAAVTRCSADVAPTSDPAAPVAPDTTCTGATCVRVGRCEPGQASAQFRAQTELPARVSPSVRLPMSVTFTNCSGADWTRDAFALVPVDLEAGVAWGARRVELPPRVADGEEVTLRFELQAPLNAGRYGLSWAVAHERVEVFQEHSPEQVVEVLAPGDCSQAGAPIRFRSQVAPPAFLGTGQRVRASVTFTNCNASALDRAGGWRLASRADPADTWGDANVELPADVPFGAEFTVPLELTAPSRPGRYRFAWQMARNGTGVGETSPAAETTVLAPADCENVRTPARFVSQSAPPGTVDPNQTFDVRATFANCSDRVWDGSFHLDTALDGNARPWNAGPVDLPLAVGPGYQIDVPFRVRAPGVPGRYPYRWGITAPSGLLQDPSPASDITVRCVPRCGDHNCGGDGCGGSCGSCPGGYSCDGAHCQAPDRPVCGELQWWNSYITYEHISSGWRDTDLGVRSGTRIQLRHTSRLERTGVYAWGYMPEFTDLATGARFRFLHLRPQNQWATDVGRVYPAGYVVGLSGGDTRDTGLGPYSTGSHLCVQTLWSYRDAFPRGNDVCR